MKSKPSNLKYTDLCIYIDKTVYNRDEDNNPISLREMTQEEETKVYEYLCNLIIALAHSKKLFPRWEQYEEFAYSYASDVYLRMTSKKQVFNSTNVRRLKPIKSILNYIKNTIYFVAINYRNSTYEQIISKEHEGQDTYDNISDFCVSQIEQQYCKDVIREIIYENLQDICSVINRVLNNSIYKRSKQRNDVELSILLSLNSFLSLTEKQKLSSDRKQMKMRLSKLDNWKNSIIIWNNQLDKNIIIVLIERIFEIIRNNINDDKNDNYLPEDVVKDILSSALPSYGVNNVEEE